MKLGIKRWLGIIVVKQNVVLSWKWAKLDIEDINFALSLIIFVLSNNYFMFYDKIYKQIHSCTMGSPISPVVANLWMEEIKESAISASSVAPEVWKCYVDNSFCIIKKDEIPAFHVQHNQLFGSSHFLYYWTWEQWPNPISWYFSIPPKWHHPRRCLQETDNNQGYLDFNSYHDINIKKAQQQPFNTAIELWNPLIPQKEEIENLTKSIQPYSPKAILLNLLTISRQEEPDSPQFLRLKNWLVCCSN